MKIYSGELKDGMPYTDIHGTPYIYKKSLGLGFNESLIKAVHYNNEWQLYKPQVKRVWGIPEVNQPYFFVQQIPNGKWCAHEIEVRQQSYKGQFLCRGTAEQHAKALNMANEFRLLSDAPVDGVKQWCINSYGINEYIFDIDIKLQEAVFGTVFNTKEQAEQALAKFPQIHIANKIIQFGFHGIVEERL